MSSKLFKENDDFDLEAPTDDEGTSGLLQRRRSPSPSKKMHRVKVKPILTFEDKMIWYLRGIFLLLLVQVGLLIGVLVATVVFVPIVVTSSQYSRAVNLIDRVYDLHDYTKTMTEMATNSKTQVETFDVPDIMKSIKSITTQGASIMSSMKPETVQALSDTGTKLVHSLQQVDFEQAKQLMQHANTWATTIDPTKVAQGMEEMQQLLKKGNDVVKQAQDVNLVQHMGDFAAGGVELEARLKRLNEVTIKLP